MRFEEFKLKVKKSPLFGGDVAGLFAADPQMMRNQLLRWKKRGLVVRLRKGLYALSREERRTALSKELIAASLYQPSYISLETALSYHKMIPERAVSVTSVTTRKTSAFKNEEGLFLYRHLKQNAYFGFRQARDEAGFPYFIAEPEKALLDLLYFNLSKAGNDLGGYLRDSLRLQNKSVLNKRKLTAYAARYGVKKLLKIVGGWQ
jgi:predicted transcriptional regulator of viral defense system